MTAFVLIRTRAFRLPFICVAVITAGVLAACGGDDPKPAETEPDSASMAAALEAYKSRQALADSVVTAAPAMDAVVKELGAARYAAADSALTAAVLRESEKTRDCYTNALREYDPNLTAVLYVLVNFGGAGWDLMRVEKWSYSSPAGGAVVACINSRAKAEWKLPTRGIVPGAHLVRLVYRPDSSATLPPQ